MLPERTADVRSAVDEWVEQETRHGIRYEKDNVECDASGDGEEGKEHCLLKYSLE